MRAGVWAAVIAAALALGVSVYAWRQADRAPRVVAVDVRALKEWARDARTPREARMRAERLERALRRMAARNRWIVVNARAVLVGAPDVTRIVLRSLGGER